MNNGNQMGFPLRVFGIRGSWAIASAPTAIAWLFQQACSSGQKAVVGLVAGDWD